MSATAPLLGIALELPLIPLFRDWIMDGQRDVEIQDFCLPHMLDGDWRPRADAIRAALPGYSGRLGLHGPFYGLSIASMDPEVRAVVRRRMEQGLDICAHLSATQMVIHSPFTTWDHYNTMRDAPLAPERVGRAHDTLAAVVRRAEAQGVELVIENIEDMDPAARVALAQSFGSAAVKVSLDTGHANYAHRAQGAPPVDQYVRAAGDMLAHIHLQDTDGYADRHWPPGDGNVPWREVFRALGQTGANPRLLLEVDDVPTSRRGAEFLAGLGVVR
ncbi:MAG: sugar phosphate isomerase/epimerase family protein [Beijerinckiaceae bacterium]